MAKKCKSPGEKDLKAMSVDVFFERLKYFVQELKNLALLCVRKSKETKLEQVGRCCGVGSMMTKVIVFDGLSLSARSLAQALDRALFSLRLRNSGRRLCRGYLPS